MITKHNIPTSQGHYKLQNAWFKVTPIDNRGNFKSCIV